LATFVNALPLCHGTCTQLPTTLGPVFQKELQRFPKAMPIVNSNVTCAPFDGTNPTVCTSIDAYGLTIGIAFGNR